MQTCPVSVVIPCYCCAATIGRALVSVNSQTFRPAEVILVNDGCGGDMIKTLSDLTQQYNKNWLRIIELPINLGAASARNAGWAVATQPYIAFLDADDSWHPDKLRIQYEYMQYNQNVALCGHQCVWLHDSEIPPVQSKLLHSIKISAGSLLFKNAFSTPTVMLRRDIPFRFQEHKRCAEDLLLWQQIAFAGLQVVRIESPLAYVHKPFYGADGLSAQLWKMEQGELDCFTLLYRTHKINLFCFLLVSLFSLSKFMVRLCSVFIFKIKRLN